ncbi:hypothetical protein AgCh_019914 [Apium graveolens]
MHKSADPAVRLSVRYVISFDPLTPRAMPLLVLKGSNRTLSSLGCLIHAGRMNVMYHLNRGKDRSNSWHYKTFFAF